MGGGLAARLKRIQEMKRTGKGDDLSGPRGPIAKAAVSSSGNTAPHGWRRLGPLLLFRESAFDIDFPTAIDARPFLLRRLSDAFRSQSAPEEGNAGEACLEGEIASIERSRLLFFDIETTGLSSGAGTIAFAFGLGSFTEEAFTVRQLFLEDYQGEPEFLATLLGMIPQDAVLVSYNGAAFDLAVMRTRCILSGMRFPERGHIDLLRTARRLWARPCGGAALSLLEEKVLAAPRYGDVPGSEAPERFFDFLRSSDFSRVEPTLDHHRLDIASLPALMREAGSVFSSPLCAKDVDDARLGLCLAALGRSEWTEVLKRGFERGVNEAGAYLATLYKRKGEWQKAVALWESLPVSYKTLREIAIAYGKGLGNQKKARNACLRALSAELLSPQRQAFEKRLERIEAKLAKNDKKRTISD